MRFSVYTKAFVFSAFVLLPIFSCFGQTAKLIHFWDFNNTVPLTGVGDIGANGDSLGNSKYPLPVEYTTLPLSGARIVYYRPHAKQGTAPRSDSVLNNEANGSYYYDFSSKNYSYYTSSDSSAAAAVCSCSGNLSIKAQNPSLNSDLYLYVPTTGYMNIFLNYATSVTNINGAQYNIFSYSTNGGTTWNNLTQAMDTFNISGVKKPDTLVVLNTVTTAGGWYPVNINFSSDNNVNNNPSFIIRLSLAGTNAVKTNGSDKYDNIAISGDSICPVITTQPKNVTICPLTDTIFTIGVLGGLNKIYQWQQNSGGGFSNISNGGVYGGTNTDSLKLSNVPVTMSGYQFRCIVICSSCKNDTSAFATISFKPYPAVIANTNANGVCPEGSVTLTGSGAVSYVWTGGVSNGIAFFPVVSQTYTVTGTGPNGCTDTASIKINVNTLPIVKANASPDSVCAGGTVTLTGSGAKTYIWTGGASNGIPFAPAASQGYTVTGTDSNGCINTASVNVTVNALPGVKANSSLATVCIGNDVTLTGSGAVSYIWTGGITNGVAFAPASTQSYTVMGTDMQGCINKDSITITVNPLPVVKAGLSNDTVCSGGNVTLTGSGAVSYVWTGGVSNGIAFFPVVSQTYTVTGTGPNGCTDTTSIKINVNTLPVVKANASPDSVCAGSTVTLTGSGAKTYIWTGGASNGIPFAPAASQGYTVTGTDSNGCINTASVNVTVNALPGVKANSSPATVCIGNDVTLIGSGAVSYVWTGGVTNGVAFAPASTQSYTVMGTDMQGCINKDSITVTVNLLPVVTASSSNDTVCSEGNVTLTGSGAVSYVWTGGASNGKPFALASSTTFTVTGTDGNGCKDTASIKIYTKTLPDITIIGNASTCSGDTTSITALGGLTYSWSTGSSSASIIVSPTVTATYSITGSDGTCSNDTSITIHVTPFPKPVINSSISICIGNSASIKASGGTTYNWSPSGSLNSVTSSNPVASPLVTTTYTVVMANGVCTTKDSVTVKVNSLPVESVAPANINEGIGQSTVASVTPQAAGNIYEWLPTEGLSCSNCSDPEVSPIANTSYTVVITDSNGCMTSDTINVTVFDDCGHLFVPNVFSPNGDGHNDQLKVYGICIKTMDFSIYDRWGNKVFQSNSQSVGWDGTYDGKRMNKGDYAYYLKATLLDGTEINMNGNAALLR